jgi:hypothetical protein
MKEINAKFRMDSVVLYNYELYEIKESGAIRQALDTDLAQPFPRPP